MRRPPVPPSPPCALAAAAGRHRAGRRAASAGRALGKVLRRAPLATAVVLAAGLTVSAGGEPIAAAGGVAVPDLPSMRPPDLDLRAMQLLMEERRAYEPVTVLQALKGGPELRAELAMALGRAQDREGRSVLEGLLIDDQPEVRRAAAFGLGLLGDPAARPALLEAARGPDRETGALAVEALGKLATPVLAVAERLAPLPEQERWERLLPYLFRFKEEALVPIAERGLGLADAELHRWAAYALARDPQPVAAPLLRRLVADPDPLVRAWAARGLGRMAATGGPGGTAGAGGNAGHGGQGAGGGADLALLAPLLGDAEAGPVIEALRAGAALAAAAGAGKAPAAAAWRPRLLALLSDPRAGVRMAAIEAAGAWLPDPGLADALAARAAPAPAAPAAPPAPAAAAPAAARVPATAARPPTLASTAAPSAHAVPPASVPLPAAVPPAATSTPPAAAASPVSSPTPAVERGLALVALAHGRDARAAELARSAAAAAEPRLRARAAEAAGLLGDSALLYRLAADTSPLVREAALTARLPSAPRPPAPAGAVGDRAAGDGAAHRDAEGSGKGQGTAAGAKTSAAGAASRATGNGRASGAASGAAGNARAGGARAGAPVASGYSESAERAGGLVAATALGDADEGVRATACDWLADHPVVPLAALAGALGAALRDESIESPLGAIKALAARADAEPRERGAAIELLERIGGQRSAVLRREAAAALARLGRPAPPPLPAPGGRAGAPGELGDDLDTYRQIVERTRRPRTVEVRTTRGSFRVRLDCPAAPRTCLNFLELAGQRFYDGLAFHRVVPDFVIQAGDPRGDGFGGPGYTVRDEIGRLRYRRGTVGMALAGPDTGGSQFFVTLSPQPHLDGGYTAFGEVVAGAPVLDAIEAGDLIEAIVEVP
jgi:cyclophilin family peptidyl-prolyl cis-trans isomerase